MSALDAASLVLDAHESAQSSAGCLADADFEVGLPNTLRQPALNCGFCLCMPAMIRVRSGISDEHRRMTSPFQRRCASSCEKAWLDAGHITRPSARAERYVRS